MAKLEFWYEFASTYSYLTAMRIEDLARRSGVELVWQPFLLGPIFVAQGWNTSPFNIFEAKGRYMWRDMERVATDRGLDFRRPDPFPQNGLTAARLALIGLEDNWTPEFTRAVYQAEFGDGADISDPKVLGSCLQSVGRDAEADLARTQDQAIKDQLKEATSRAVSLGIFGAPSFVVDDELFWGDDRLEQALDYARRS